MTLTRDLAGQRARYNRDAILSASPATLVTMLYDRLLLDLARAEAAQRRDEWDLAQENLLHAQSIIAELSSSLNPHVWDGAAKLFGVYNYVTGLLISANIGRDSGPIRECVTLLEPLRQAWHGAADALPIRSVSTSPCEGLGIA